MATISLRNVNKRFGTVEVVRGLNLEIADRELLVIVGPSGCGKSTLLRMIAGLEVADTGDIFIDGALVYDRKNAADQYRSDFELGILGTTGEDR